MAVRLTWPLYTRFDLNGKPVSGAQLFFYESGTTTKLDTFPDERLLAETENDNPMVADGNGEFGDIWLQLQDYKIILTSATDTDPPTGGTTFDPVQGNPAVSGDDFKASPQSPADMTVLVGAGSIFNVIDKTLTVVAAQTSALVVAPTTNPRNDIVYMDRLTGADGTTTGVESASPTDPTIPDDKLPVARIRTTVGMTEIVAADIDDIRELNLLGSIGGEHIQGQTFTAFDDTGAVNAYVITPVPAITAYAKYQAWVVDIANANTGAATMVNSGLAARNIFDHRTGAALIGGEMVAGIHHFVDDGMQLLLMDPANAAPTSVTVLDRDNSANEIVNTVTETDLYNFTVPANTLGTDGIIRGFIAGEYFNNSGGSRAFILRIKYGSTTMYQDISLTIPLDTNIRGFAITYEISAVDSTSVQALTGTLIISAPGAATTGYGELTLSSSLTAAFGGAAAEDSTTALALNVTIEHDTANASLSIKANQRHLELL